MSSEFTLEYLVLKCREQIEVALEYLNEIDEKLEKKGCE